MQHALAVQIRHPSPHCHRQTQHFAQARLRRAGARLVRERGEHAVAAPLGDEEKRAAAAAEIDTTAPETDDLRGEGGEISWKNPPVFKNKPADCLGRHEPRRARKVPVMSPPRGARELGRAGSLNILMTLKTPRKTLNPAHHSFASARTRRV